MGKITYLFGAGASAKAMPTISDIKNRITEIIKLLEKNHFNAKDNIPSKSAPGYSYKELHDFLINDFHSFIKSWEDFNMDISIDGFMRHQFDNTVHWYENNSDYQLYKKIIAAYFSIEQISNDKKTDDKYIHYIDDRYIHFLQNIIESGKIPNSIKILTWNYDLQIELAFMKAYPSRVRTIDDARDELKIYSQKTLPSLPEFVKPTSIFKLNGTACHFDRSNMRYIDNFWDPNDKSIHKILDNWRNKNECLLSYSWEEHNGLFVKTITRNTEDTENLIVIGYSFPIENIVYDSEIINNMEMLKHIYIQELSKDRFEQVEKTLRLFLRNSDIIISFHPSDKFLILW